MARRKVVVTPIMEVKKTIHKDLGGGKLGLIQRRKMKNTVKSEVLSCRLQYIASKMAGKKFDNLGAVQSEFAKHASDSVAVCKK